MGADERFVCVIPQWAIPIIKGCKAAPFHGVCFVPLALSLALSKRRMEGGVCFNFGAENQLNMFFTKQLEGMHSNHWMT